MSWLKVFLLIGLSLLVGTNCTPASKDSAEVVTPTQGKDNNAEPAKPNLRAYDADDEERLLFDMQRVVAKNAPRIIKLRLIKKSKLLAESPKDLFEKWVAYKYPVIVDGELHGESVLKLFKSKEMERLEKKHPNALIESFVGYYGLAQTIKMIDALKDKNAPTSKMAKKWIDRLIAHWKKNPADLESARKITSAKESHSLSSYERQMKMISTLRSTNPKDWHYSSLDNP